MEHSLREMIKLVQVIAEESEDAALSKLLDSKSDVAQALVDLGRLISRSIPLTLFQKEPYSALSWSSLIYLSSKALTSKQNKDHLTKFLNRIEVREELGLILTYLCELERVEATRLEAVPYETTFSRLEIPRIESEVEKYLQEDYSCLAWDYWHLFKKEQMKSSNEEGKRDQIEEEEVAGGIVTDDLSLKLSLLFLFTTFGKLADHLCLHGLPYATQVFFEEMQQFQHSDHRREVIDSWLWNAHDHTLYQYYTREGEEIGMLLKQLTEFVGEHHHRHEEQHQHPHHSHQHSYSANKEKEETLLSYLHRIQSHEEKKEHDKKLEPAEEILSILRKTEDILRAMNELIGVPEFVDMSNGNPNSTSSLATMKMLQVNFLYDQYIVYNLQKVRELGKLLPSFPFHELLMKCDLTSSSCNQLPFFDIHDLDYLADHVIEIQKQRSVKNFNYENNTIETPHAVSFFVIQQHYYSHRYQQILKLLPTGDTHGEGLTTSERSISSPPHSSGAMHGAKGFHQKSLEEVIHCVEHHVHQLLA